MYSSTKKKPRNIISLIRLLYTFNKSNRYIENISKCTIDNYNKITGDNKEQLQCLIKLQYYIYYTISDIHFFIIFSYLFNNFYLKSKILRYICTLVYESFSEIELLKGSVFQNIVNSIKSNKIKELLKIDLLRLRKFKKEWSSEFGKIRNNIGAHRNIDIRLFDRYIKSLNAKTVTDLSIIYISILTCLSTVNAMMLIEMTRSS
jgi:hypothetical protein